MSITPQRICSEKQVAQMLGERGLQRKGIYNLKLRANVNVISKWWA